MLHLSIINRITKMPAFYCHRCYFDSTYGCCGLQILILNGSGLQIQTNGGFRATSQNDRSIERISISKFTTQSSLLWRTDALLFLLMESLMQANKWSLCN